MVGIVLVSHSRALASALKDLVRQVASPDVQIAIAAGVGPEHREFGTDAVEIMDAIQSVESGNGVLLLMDLGSAVLSAEMAVELLPGDLRERVHFCAAPLVEGAITAAIQAGLGSDAATICREARQALLPKEEQLGQAENIPVKDIQAVEPVRDREASQEIRLALQNQHGLHARPAARFVQLAASFDAQVEVENRTKGKGPVSARSLNALATLAAVRGDEILIRATGSEAKKALDALAELVASNFGETAAEEDVVEVESEKPPVTAELPPGLEGVLQGIPVSDGVAIGPLLVYKAAAPKIPEFSIEQPQEEWQRLLSAVADTKSAIQQRRTEVALSLGEKHAAIFEAHQLILDDPELLGRVETSIQEKKQNAEAAWFSAIQETMRAYQELEDPYLQQRAADVEDVGLQVLSRLTGEAADGLIELTEPVILYAQDLTPTQTAALDLDMILGIVTAAGGPTSHAAILARAMGIPAAAGVNIARESLARAPLVGLDGFHGQVWLDPQPDVTRALTTRRDQWLKSREEFRKNRHLPAQTLDGRRVEVAANVGKLADAQSAVENGAEGIGLLRTEFLFLTRTEPPSEEAQYSAMRAIFDVMGDRPVIVRTLDVGGDKALPYIHLPQEANPFLGVRAIRLSLREPALFHTQLRAILRAGAKGRLRLMFPMIATVNEVEQALNALQAAHRSLASERLDHAWPVETGIMVEIPSVALMSEAVAQRVDFFSIGTNDLTQYTMAAERGSAALAELSDPMQPAVLRLISRVVEAAHAHKKWVGVCGEMAGNSLAVPLLVGLGVDELSLSPGGIPRVKAILRNLPEKDARELAQKALQAESLSEIRALAEAFFQKNLSEVLVS